MKPDDVGAGLDPTSWPWLQAALRSRSQAIRSTFLAGHSSDAWIAKLGWTAGQLGAHMVSVPRIYRRIILSTGPFEIPASMGAFGLSELEAVGTTNLEELGDLLVEAVEQLLEVLGDNGDADFPFYSMTHSAKGVAGIALSELQLHHRDLSAVTGEKVEITNDHIRATLRGMMPASTIFYDASVARNCAGTYHLHIRDVDDWTIRVADGRVCVELGRPRRADVRISGAGLPFVLTAFGRELPVRSVLTGKLYAYGWKLWKLLPLQKLFVEELSLAAPESIV